MRRLALVGSGAAMGAAVRARRARRKLLSIPLISASSWDSLRSAGAARALLAPQHSTLQHWTPSSSVPRPDPPASAAAAPVSPGATAVVPSTASASAQRALSLKPAASISKRASAMERAVSMSAPSAPVHLTLPGSLYLVRDRG